MGEVIWVEVLTRGRGVLARHRCPGPEVRIGRGYDNDVVLDDPYVAPQHLRVERDAGGLIAVDLGGGNGSFVDGERKAFARLALDGEQLLRVGRTHLRIRGADHAVPAARPAAASGRRWPLLLGLGAAILGVQALALWLAETGEPRPSLYATILLLPSLAVVWSAIWALISRVFAGQAQFARQLVIAFAGLLALLVYDQLAGILGFALSWRLPAEGSYVAMWCLLALACLAHLIGIERSAWRLQAAILAGLLAVTIGIHTLMRSDWRDGIAAEPAQALLPPAFRLVPAQPETAFLAGLAQLKPKLDRARTEEPTDSWLRAVLESDD